MVVAGGWKRQTRRLCANGLLTSAFCNFVQCKPPRWPAALSAMRMPGLPAQGTIVPTTLKLPSAEGRTTTPSAELAAAPVNA